MITVNLRDENIGDNVAAIRELRKLGFSDEAIQRLYDRQVVKDTNVPNKWIPVTERLPEENRDVLCFGSYNGTRLSYQCVLQYHACLERFDKFDFCGVKHGGFVDYDSETGYFERSTVTHWMPLPEPPKEDA